MDNYEIELDAAGPEGFAVTVAAFPGLLIFGATVDEVLARARASIAFHLRTRDSELLTDQVELVPRGYTGSRRYGTSSWQP